MRVPEQRIRPRQGARQEHLYRERSVAAGTAPVVHETAHQWVGDAVSERVWDGVWLSEGFATYFTLLYAEHASGRDAFVAGLRRSRDSVFRLEDTSLPDTPVVHPNFDVSARSSVPAERSRSRHNTMKPVTAYDEWTGQ